MIEDTKLTRILDSARRIQLKSGLSSSIAYLESKASKALSAAELDLAVALVTDLVSLCRTEIQCEEYEDQMRIIRTAQKLLKLWGKTFPEHCPGDLFQLSLILYNVEADSEKTEGRFEAGLNALLKADRLIQGKDVPEAVVCVAYTKVNLSTLCLAGNKTAQALVYADQCIDLIRPRLSVSFSKSRTEVLRKPLTNSLVLAYFNKAVAEEAVGLQTQAISSYQHCLELGKKTNYEDNLLMSEAKWALAHIEEHIPESKTSTRFGSRQFYYNRATLFRIAEQLKRKDCCYFISMGKYFHRQIHKKLQLDKDVPHIPVFTK